METKTDKDKEYNKYIRNHVKNVGLAYSWLQMNLPEIFNNSTLKLDLKIATHDLSKESKEEFSGYRDYFYGVRTPDVNREFDYAWLHHIHNNDHHWNYWVIVDGVGDIKALDMPYDCIIEMVCDHWSFSWSKNNLYEIFDWYRQHKSSMIMSDKTRKTYEYILDKIKGVLDSKLS